jgi:hypothetical protein
LTSYWHSLYNWLLGDTQSISDSFLAFNLLLNPNWQSIYNWSKLIISLLLTPYLPTAWRNKIYNQETVRAVYIKLHEWNPNPFVSRILIFSTWDFLK